MRRISVVVCTLDEELHVARCLDSVSELGPAFIVDAGSSDATEAIAATAGATCVSHEWSGYSAQKNWALENLPITTDWVLMLDADEYVTPSGRKEIAAALESTTHAGFYLPRQNIFMGKVLKHAWWYPDYQLRLFRREAGRYEDRLVHEHLLLEGTNGFLAEPLLHENLKSTDAFLERHRKYAELEAREIEKWRRGDVRGQREGRLLGSWPERRRALKTGVWYRFPGRPYARFVWMYVLKRGFLDGRAGLKYSRLLATYERMIDRKLRDLEASK